MADSSPAETRSAVFTNPEKGKASLVNIISERLIGEGVFGKVYEADVLVHGKKRKFVIKKFKGFDIDGLTAREDTVDAMANYQRAKKAGLKVFTTYRLGDDGTSILMTNGETDSTLCIGKGTESMLPARGEPLIENIDEDKFLDLTNQIFNQAFIADSHGISLHNDAFFFLVNKQTNEIDFVLGDLDRVDDRPVPPNQIRLLNNLRAAGAALENFLLGNVKDGVSYRDISHREYQQIIISQGYGNV